jgi:DNA/RNA endonuclease G (NUC1)
MKLRIFHFQILALCFALTTTVTAQERGFSNCASMFPGDALSGVPKPARTRVPANNLELCYRTGNQAFFAVAYNETRRLADWVAYRVQNTFGADKCGSVPREHIGCYFKMDDVASCIRDEKGSDPFHADWMLSHENRPHLGIEIYSGTGHDRGHLAPNNAFSWHACGAYQTFTMANMAPQIAWLNRNAWKNLEEQELYWGVTSGPIYIFTGPIYREFPSSSFEIIRNGTIRQSEIVKPSSFVSKAGVPVKPKVPQPTGFFKVIIRPATASSEAQAIGYLFPHTEQKGYKFPSFRARIDLIERVSDLRFAVPENLKGAWNDSSWKGGKVPGKWSVRGQCANGFSPQGWDKSIKAAKDRVDACIAASRQ